MQTRATIHSLNGLRAVSVLIVVAAHCGFGNLIPGGLGVSVFFFLSGFLITRLLTDEHARDGRISLRDFYVKRFFRLTPPLFALLAASSALVAAGVLPGHVTPGGLAAQALYLTNYYSLFWDTGNTIAPGTGILWSLAVEEHFYCVYPVVLLFLLGRYSNRTVFKILAGACIAILVWRMVLAASPGFDSNRTYYSTDTRIDSILYGCLLALGWRSEAARTAESGQVASIRRLLFAAGLLLLCLTLVIRAPYFRETARYSLQGIALLPVFHAILCADRGALHRVLNHPAVSKLGEYSYAVYLVHFVVANLLTSHTRLGASRGWLLAVDIALSCAIAAAMHRCIEMPSLRLRERVLAVARRNRETAATPELAA